MQLTRGPCARRRQREAADVECAEDGDRWEAAEVHIGHKRSKDRRDVHNRTEERGQLAREDRIEAKPLIKAHEAASEAVKCEALCRPHTQCTLMLHRHERR